jgi:hypothetical protein
VQPHLDLLVAIMVLATVIPVLVSTFRRRRKASDEPATEAAPAQTQSSTASV